MKARRLLGVLERRPLGYRVVRRAGSHREPDGWWAESPDIKGWSAAGATYAEVLALVEEGVPFALGHDAKLEHVVPPGEHLAA